MFYQPEDNPDKLVTLADAPGLDGTTGSNPTKNKEDIGPAYAQTMSWVEKVIEMRERLYHARSSGEFKKVKAIFAKEEPLACANMLKDPDIMFTIPKEWEPNETNTSDYSDTKLQPARTNTTRKPEQQYGNDSDGTIR